MKLLLQSLKNYLYETLKTNIETLRWKKQSNLPIFLTDAYDFYETTLFNQTCLLMIAHKNNEIAPGTIRKHQEQIQKNWDESIIYVQTTLSSYNRKRLIEHHIPFIIPGNQMYLPQCGIDLREYFRKTLTKKDTNFSPSTQTVVIYALLRKSNESLSPSILAEKLGYTLMTMTRAFNELEALKIGKFYREGKERLWTFQDKSTLWMNAKSFLQNPIKKRIWVKNHPVKIFAGLSALSHFSQLSPPRLPVFAISGSKCKLFKQSEFEEVPSSDDAIAEIEIWNYDPELFTKDRFVDPVSLYCSLKTDKDERIESCLKEMMEKFEW